MPHTFPHDAYSTKRSRHRIKVVAQQLLSTGPDGVIAAALHTRAHALIGGAVVHDERALHGLDDLANGDLGRLEAQAHTAAHATQALHDAGLNQTVLNRASERIRDIHRLGGGTDRQKALVTFGKHRQHSEGVIGFAGDIHLNKLLAGLHATRPQVKTQSV